MLSTQAFNALLKTLEEPPPHVVFVLATTEVHKIPSHDPVALPALRLQADPDRPAGRAPARRSSRPRRSPSTPDGVRLLARQAAGSVRDALSLLDQVIAYVGDERPSRASGWPRCWGWPTAGCWSSWPRRCSAATRRRRCAWWPQAVDRGIDLGQLARVVPGLPPRRRGRGPGRSRARRDSSTPPPTSSPRRGRWRPGRPRGCCRRCSTAGRARWTRRGKSQTPRLLLEMAAGRPLLRRAAGSRWATCCSAWTSWRGGCRAGAPPGPGPGRRRVAGAEAGRRSQRWCAPAAAPSARPAPPPTPAAPGGRPPPATRSPPAPSSRRRRRPRRPPRRRPRGPRGPGRALAAGAGRVRGQAAAARARCSTTPRWSRWARGGVTLAVAGQAAARAGREAPGGDRGGAVGRRAGRRPGWCSRQRGAAATAAVRSEVGAGGRRQRRRPEAAARRRPASIP